MVGVVLGPELVKEERGWVCRGIRPGSEWVGHGYTTKTVIVLFERRVFAVALHKQRWRHRKTGKTIHDRPVRDVPWSTYGFAVVMAATWSWMASPRGLHHVQWPWSCGGPSLRTIQRWMARLLADALAWQIAIRGALAERLAPATLDEKVPAGLPPPGGLTRWRRSAAKAWQLSRGLSLLQKSASLVSIPPTALAVEARRRFLDENLP